MKKYLVYTFVAVILLGAGSIHAETVPTDTIVEVAAEAATSTAVDAQSREVGETATSTSVIPDMGTSTSAESDVQPLALESELVPPTPQSVSEEPPAPVPSPEAPPPPEPAPTVQPVVPFISVDGRGFDPATAPSQVRLTVRDPRGNIPTSPVFVSFIGVGGRSYGGPLTNDGAITAIMPSGRYYADFLVVDTRSGPPANPPAFFLEANEERDLGVILLSDVSTFTDRALEAEVNETLEEKGGFGKVFGLIVKLLLAILKEVRGIRVDMLSQ